MTYRASEPHRGPSRADDRNVTRIRSKEGIMATSTHPEQERRSPTAELDYYAAEAIPRPEPERERALTEWTMVAAGLAGLVAILAIVLGAFALPPGGGPGGATTIVKRSAAPAAAAAPAKAPTLADAKGVAFEKFEKVDPSLPAVPAGPVKKFTVDVLQHVM